MFHKSHVRLLLLTLLTLPTLTLFISAGIFSSSIKSNILFGKEYNHRLFQRVVEATALDSVRSSLCF